MLDNASTTLTARAALALLMPMNTCITRRSVALGSALLTALLPLTMPLPLRAAPAAPQELTAYDSQRPRWTKLELKASKLFMSANARVEARLLPAGEVAAQLLDTPTGRPVPAGERVLSMTYAASGFGRESLTTLWADPVTGATLQRTQLDGGNRQRQRSYRFADVGAYHYTRWPATPAEKSQPPAQWTKREEGMRAYPAGAVNQPVTEATALLWLAAAAPLAQKGERIEVLTFSRRHVNRVLVEVTGRRKVEVDFQEQSAAGTKRRRERIDALVLRLRGAPLDAGADAEDFELLGLSGDLELLLDPVNRLPLELHGRVKVAGQVTVRLRSAVLR